MTDNNQNQNGDDSNYPRTFGNPHLTSVPNKVPLDVWISDVMTDKERENPLSIISLVHLKGETEIDVDHVKFLNKSANYDAKTLAKRFRGKAQQFVQDLPGTHTFCLLAFFGTQEILSRQPFVIRVTQDFGSLGTDAPDEKGLLQAKMRRDEASWQQNHMKQVHQDNFGLRLLDRYETQNAMLMRQVNDMFDLNQRMAIQLMTISHDKEMEKLKFMHDRNERAALLKMAPGLINTITGQEIIPQSQEDTAIVEAMAEKLTPEAFAMVKSALGLPDEVTAVLADRLNRYHTKKLKEQEEMKQLPGFRGDPKDDIGGGPK